MDRERESSDDQFLFSCPKEGHELEDVTTLLRAVVTDAETGRWEWRLETESLHCDEHTEELFGYDPGEFPGTYEALLERVHPDDRDRVAAECGPALTEEVYDATFRVVVDGQATWWIHARGVAVPGEGDSSEKLVGLVTDVSGDRTSERKLERFRALVEHSPDGLTHIRPDGTMTFVSGGERVLGRPQEEFLGEPLERFLHPDDTQRALDFFEGLREGDDPAPFEGRIQHADGTWIWIETTAIALDDSSNVEGVLTVTRDISERKKVEQRLEDQRDDLEILNRVVRHDIRNDLQVIAGNTELVEEYVTESGEPYLETIRESTTNAVELTQKARELADEMLHTESDVEEIHLSPVLRAELEEVSALYPDAEITTEGELPNVSVSADELLDAVFRNLLKNAIQHSDETTPEVSISVERSDGTVEVHVADNGPGISDSMKETVFEEARRGLKRGEGGIGLYLVQSLVDRYDGDIRVEDNTPKGAVFVVQLDEAE